ncbi:MAG: hypothetical protein HOM25_09140 [Rhodospirillaceae bacterium]|jgi:hypothetical protein|nr:hypothetical protein [Rhodospirillaceae bacterium]MBT5664478.1 hypothetical protein [Rhodospirillaceae bacterium]
MKKGGMKFDAGVVSIVVRHEQWDGNIHGRVPDQGVMIFVRGQVDGKDATLLRFNCCDVNRDYIYDPDGMNKVCGMDPILDGNPIGWTMRQLRERLPDMVSAAGFEDIAGKIDTQLVASKLGEIEDVARKAFHKGRLTVKHNRGTDIFEAGAIRFGLEMRTLGDDGGLAIHVMADLSGTPNGENFEETELLAFDCFRKEPHYHYGPRNKNHRIYFDKTVVPDPLEWTLDVLKARKIRDMIAAAGYPGVAADVDEDIIASLLPSIEAKARELQPA